MLAKVDIDCLYDCQPVLSTSMGWAFMDSTARPTTAEQCFLHLPKINGYFFWHFLAFLYVYPVR